jgi:4-hydroxy-4-methyl-2-oxoglutarate aldolase
MNMLTSERLASGPGEHHPVKGVKATLNPELLDSLGQLDACILANAIESFHARLRNEGFADHTVRCLSPHLPPMVGYAATLKIRGSAPPTAGDPYADKPGWWDYILNMPSPRVLVVQDAASRPGLGAWIGAVEMNILHALQCVGVVTDGSVRDVPAAANAGLHLFASGVSVSRAYTHVVEIGSTVEIGGLRIHSGDLIHGDLHGVQSIPLNIAAELPDVAAQIRLKEEALVALCRSPELSLENLRAVLESVSG